MGKFDFKFSMPFEKAERDGEWYLTALASGPEVDAQNERFAPAALQGFVKQIERSSVPFLNWHNAQDALAEMGEVSKAWLDEGFHMGVEIKLDQDDYRAQKLWKKLDETNPRTGKTYEYGLSVAGAVNDYKDEYEKGTRVRTYYDVTLDEISLTTKPIYTHSLGTVLRKAAEAAENVEGDMENTTPNVAEETVTTENVDKTVETPDTSGEQVSEPETTATEDKSEVDKAASARTAEDARKLKKLLGMHREMASLLAEFVISSNETETPNTDSTTTEAQPVKSEETLTTTADDSVLKAEIAELREELHALRESTAAVKTPGVVLQKSDADEFSEMLKSMSPDARLRFALQAIQESKK